MPPTGPCLPSKNGTRNHRRLLQPWKKRIPARRMQDMLKGLDLLELWLHDLLRVGIHTLETNSDIILHIARRMVDHKLGGIGRRLRRWYTYLGEEDWPHILLDEIGSLYLAIQAMRKLDNLPEDLPEDLLAMMGVSIRRNDLLAHPDRICGRYTCTGVVVRTEETNMRSIWTWLVNAERLEFALLLDFEVDRVPSERFDSCHGLGVRNGAGGLSIGVAPADAGAPQFSCGPPRRGTAPANRLPNAHGLRRGSCPCHRHRALALTYTSPARRSRAGFSRGSFCPRGQGRQEPALAG
ncbi:MAG: hypothetical protein KatS3mg029_0625 [Saprospiraceae bacterium]|nr:MAG: hypothetical protein KatS3mg029_0625 [Saprospiraceae bacterium]